MGEAGLKSLAENEGKTVDAAQNCQNNSVPVAEHVREAADGRGVYKVVHSFLKGTVEFIIDDGRNDDTMGKKMIDELEEARLQIEDSKRHAKKVESQLEDSRRHATDELEEARLQIEDSKRHAKKVESQLEDSRRHATEMKKMEAQQIEDSRKHATEMKAKENQRRAEIKKLNAMFEKEKKEKLQAVADLKQLKQQALRDQSARAVAATESERVESKAARATDALTKARVGSEELRTQLGVTKDQLKNEKGKREKADKLYKSTKQDFAKALKEHDEHRVIQEGIAENQEGEIARLTKVMEECVQVVASLRNDRGKASKMDEQPEEQNSAVADAKCADDETETDQRVVADHEAEVVDKYFVCRKYREGDVIGKAHMERFTRSIELSGGPIEKVRARYCDEIKPVVGLFPDEWKEAQRDKLRWYPIKLDGRTMSITRDSGAVDYISHLGRICAKEDSDIQILINKLAASNA